MTSTVINQHDDLNGSLSDDWETYKAYTKFYYITDEIFLYANPILIIIGRIEAVFERLSTVSTARLGIPTHALSMIIFLRKRMRRYPVSVFMAMLSLTNILILAGPVTMQWLNHKVFIGFVVTGSRFLCSFHVYIDLVGSSINSWLILMIAVERYLSVTKPFLIRTSFNRQQAWIIVFSVFLVAIIAPLGLAIVASSVDGCLLFFSKTYQIIGSIQIFFIYVLPSILILTLSIITVHKLRNRIRTRGSRRVHISVMLIAVSFSFITFTMPYQICWYWLFSTAIGSVKWNLKVNIINIGFRYVALTIRNLNYTLNFFLYSLTSMVFLKEAFTIAHCNYFLNQTLVERNPAFRRVRRLFSGQDDQPTREPTAGATDAIDQQDRTSIASHPRRSDLQVIRTRRRHFRFSRTSKSQSNLSIDDDPSTNFIPKHLQVKRVSLKLKDIKAHPNENNKLKWPSKVSSPKTCSTQLSEKSDGHDEPKAQTEVQD